VPLTLWFLWSALGHFGAGYADTRSFLAQPMNASLAAAFVLMLYYHAALGLSVVIEDYVHVRWLELRADRGEAAVLLRRARVAARDHPHHPGRMKT
jgi:succinate dehydrogenase hydrophobic membrane anchor protein